jgi:uncharacterized protein (DUF885 family)
MTDLATARLPTELDALAERYLDESAELDPIAATYYGMAGFDDKMPDLSPDGLQAVDDLAARTLAELNRATPVDDTDRVTATALAERLEVHRQLHAVGADLSDLKNIASPVQSMRDIFDLMPTDSADDWQTIATRLFSVPDAVSGYIASLREAAAADDVAAKRQIRACIGQCEGNLSSSGFFATFVAGAACADGAALPESLTTDLQRAAVAAQDGYQLLRDFLAEDLLPRGRETDAVGAEWYQLYSRQFLGATVDLFETYQWGIGELARIEAEALRTADRISTGAGIEEAIEALQSDPERHLGSTDELRAWMQSAADGAVDALAGVHFDIAEPIRRIECRIAPTHTGAIYYTGPSEDFSRPGRMWWSVPAGVTEFSTWRELTTVYHEGVPGHHLQIAQTVYLRDSLNRWRRLASGTSGHAEGWALYAEWLMADLGFMNDLGDYLGLLDGQSLRAARVVLDIGVHCGFPAPDEVGGGAWTYEKAWQLLTRHAHMSEGFLRFELDRYLGWPGQAPSYKVGERYWMQLRDEVKRRQGESFDLKAFHRDALNVGGVGLEVLRKAVLRQW